LQMSLLRRRDPNASQAVLPHADGGDALPIRRYDKLTAKGVTEQLRRLTQTELAAVEHYERSRQDRQQVLDKLRYLRGSEPLRGYDALDATQIAAALAVADLDTLALVREYELKFCRRDAVLDELARLRQMRRPDGEG
jgi:hypothetical protein